jgi:hypothetical protein
MKEDCGGGQGLSWAVEPRGERERDRQSSSFSHLMSYLTEKCLPFSHILP